jgi:hypothetical protein
MQLFEDIQKVVSGGGRVKVSVPPCYSTVLTNKTDDTIYLYPNQSSRIGYPLLKGESLEVENVTETSNFYTTVLDADTSEEKGLYILCRPYIEPIRPQEINNVVIQKDN